MVTHATLPFVGEIIGDNVKVFFSTRNINQESSVAFVVFDINTLQIKDISKNPVLNF